jgi:hypothetical protein
MVQYSFLVITICIAGCYGTCFCMLWYLFLVVAVDDFGTRFLLLQYSFLVASVLIFGCYSTHFGLLWELLLVVTVLVSGSYVSRFWLFTVLISGCYSTCFLSL